ncbi:MAG: VOC family protein [Burkholderiaceae bacterium]
MTTFRPPHTQPLTPYLAVQDAAKSIDFYQAAFGFTVLYSHEEDLQPIHVQMGMDGEQIIMFGPEGAFAATRKSPKTLGVEATLTFQVYVRDVDAMYGRAIAAGCVSRIAPDDMFWGERYCQVEDIDGYLWGFCGVIDD